MIEYCMTAEPIPAFKNSRFMRAILEMEISLGHSASHPLSLEQLPKQSSSIFRTMARPAEILRVFHGAEEQTGTIFTLARSITEAFGYGTMHAFFLPLVRNLNFAHSILFQKLYTLLSTYRFFLSQHTIIQNSF
jgi:hypothetical protein